MSVFNKRWLPLHPSLPGGCLTQELQGLGITPTFPSPGNPLKLPHGNSQRRERRKRAFLMSSTNKRKLPTGQRESRTRKEAEAEGRGGRAESPVTGAN